MGDARVAVQEGVELHAPRKAQPADLAHAHQPVQRNPTKVGCVYGYACTGVACFYSVYTAVAVAAAAAVGAAAAATTTAR